MKAIYFVKTLHQNSYGYTLSEKEDLRKQYVKNNINEYKDSLFHSLNVPPKDIAKPIHPIRKCRWYEPLDKETEQNLIRLLLILEIIVLINFLFLSNTSSTSEIGCCGAGFGFLTLFICLMWLINGHKSYIVGFFIVLILDILYILLSIFLFKWSKMKQKDTNIIT